VPVPQLRLISEELWTAAHARLANARQTYLRATDGRLWGKPTNGVESKYLLAGLVSCAVCGGGLPVASRSHGRERAHFYGCATFNRKGPTICPNSALIAMHDSDWALMEVLQDELLDPRVVGCALDRAVERLITPAPNVDEQLEQLQLRQAKLER